MKANVLNIVNLGSVSSDVTGSAIDTSWYTRKTVFHEISANAGSVDIDIEHSFNGTDWNTLDSSNYIGSVVNDDYSWDFNSPFIRVKTTGTSGTVVVSSIVTARGV